MKERIHYKFSVVIPTLGGDVLSRTINFINSGSLIPDEILICIPKEFKSRVSGLTLSENVKIIATECKGQVAQRIEGFKLVKNDYVIQLDDDMYVYETCFERLIEGLTTFKEDVSISPAMVFDTTKQSCYLSKYRDSTIRILIEGENWFKPGNITRTGWNIGMNTLLATERYSSVDWLPGGCVAHNKKNLILYNFFPFQGKAYYEDVIHSIHLTKKNVKLIIDKTAICGIDEYEDVPYTPVSPVNSYHKYYGYRKHIVQLKGDSLIYLLFDGLYNYFLTVRALLHYLVSNKKGKRRRSLIYFVKKLWVKK